VDGDPASKHGCRTIERVVVEEGPTTGELVLEGAQRRMPEIALVLVVIASDSESEAEAGWSYDRGRPDLDLELVDLAGRQGLDAIVGVIGPVGEGELRVEVSV
jgi:hypothetical protein